MNKPNAILVHRSDDYMSILAGAMSKCSEKDISPAAVIKHAVDAGHLSVLEHVTATIDIECSLAVLGQFVRHRHLSPTVKSSRTSLHIDFVVPEGIQGTKWEGVYTETIKTNLKSYELLVTAGIPYEDAAYLLPKATLTKLRVTGNLRAWCEYLPKRLCDRALPEHQELARLIHSELATAMPEIFSRNFKNCRYCSEHSCKFH